MKNQKNNQENQQTVKQGRPHKKKLNEMREVKITNHYANISEDERLWIGLQLFEMLGLLDAEGN